MEEFVQFSAKTKSDAITKACIELGTSSDQLEIQVVSEGSSGFFGIGSKPAIIKARRKATASAEDDMKEILGNVNINSIGKEIPKKSKDVKAAEKKQNQVKEEKKETLKKTDNLKETVKEVPEKEKPVKENRPLKEEKILKEEKAVKEEKPSKAEKIIKEEKPVKEEKAVKEEKPFREEKLSREEKTASEKKQKESKEPKEKTAAPKEKPQKPIEILTDEEEIKEVEQRAVVFLRDVFASMDLEDVDIKSVYNREEGSLDVDFEGEDMGMLIGKRGQTLDSLQYLTSLVVNKGKDHYIRVKLDTEDYRRRRKETLESLARSIANKVKKTRKPVVLEAMNPYERRIIHSALQNNRYVETVSEGEEPYRHIVVKMKKIDRSERYERNYKE